MVILVGVGLGIVVIERDSGISNSSSRNSSSNSSSSGSSSVVVVVVVVVVIVLRYYYYYYYYYYLTIHSTHFFNSYNGVGTNLREINKATGLTNGTKSLAMPEAVPASGRVRNLNVYGHVNTFPYPTNGNQSQTDIV